MHSMCQSLAMFIDNIQRYQNKVREAFAMLRFQFLIKIFG